MLTLPLLLAELAYPDRYRHFVMTTGTPNTCDRGAAYLTECAQAVRARVNLPIQAQCEPPEDFAWFARMKAAGVDSLGMHRGSSGDQWGGYTAIFPSPDR